VKGGAENRKKTIMAGVLGAVALCCILYGYNAIYGFSSSAPATTPEAVAPKTSTVTQGANPAVVKPVQTQAQNANSAPAAAPGVAAVKMASTSSSLDPTLDETAMLRTESLVYSGNGRNIFSAIYTPPVVIPTNMPSARPNAAVVAPPVDNTPPPPPPINLRFFGTAARANGATQAFLLSGEDVYLASAGDIVARKYKIVSIGTSNIQVEDLQNHNTQTLPLVK
jgi:hypothetical protein